MRKRFLQKVLDKLPIYVMALLILFTTLAPAYWLFASSISHNKELTARPIHWFPREPTFERLTSILFAETIQGAGAGTRSSPGAVFRHAMGNSFKVASVSTVLCLFLGSLSAYAFARLRFPMKGGLMVLTIAAQMIPGIALVIPLYQVIRALGMMDSLVTLIVLDSSFLLVYVIWVMSGYFRTIPAELEEAALIDGCTRMGALFKVVIPLSVPGLFATGLLCFLMAWDEFLFALIFTNSVASKTITVAMGEFSGQFQVDYGMMMAAGFLASLPPVALALIFQRYLVQGLTTGSVKG